MRMCREQLRLLCVGAVSADGSPPSTPPRQGRLANMAKLAQLFQDNVMLWSVTRVDARKKALLDIADKMKFLVGDNTPTERFGLDSTKHVPADLDIMCTKRPPELPETGGVFDNVLQLAISKADYDANTVVYEFCHIDHIAHVDKNPNKDHENNRSPESAHSLFPLLKIDLHVKQEAVPEAVPEAAYRPQKMPRRRSLKFEQPRSSTVSQS